MRACLENRMDVMGDIGYEGRQIHVLLDNKSMAELEACKGSIPRTLTGRIGSFT